LRANTEPGAFCNITVYYKSGPSEAQGLDPKDADSSGNVSWTWKVGTRTTPGTWRVITASSCGETVSPKTRVTGRKVPNIVDWRWVRNLQGVTLSCPQTI
jgi:hypothetical protein